MPSNSGPTLPGASYVALVVVILAMNLLLRQVTDLGRFPRGAIAVVCGIIAAVVTLNVINKRAR